MQVRDGEARRVLGQADSHLFVNVAANAGKSSGRHLLQESVKIRSKFRIFKHKLKL